MRSSRSCRSCSSSRAGLGVGPVPRLFLVTWRSVRRVSEGLGIFRSTASVLPLAPEALGERFQLGRSSFRSASRLSSWCNAASVASRSQSCTSSNGPSLGRTSSSTRARSHRPLRRWLSSRRRDPGGRPFPALWIRVPVSGLACEMELLDFFRLCSGLPRHIRSRAGEQRLLPLQTSPLRANSQLFLKRLEVRSFRPRVPVEWST